MPHHTPRNSVSLRQLLFLLPRCSAIILGTGDCSAISVQRNPLDFSCIPKSAQAQGDFAIFTMWDKLKALEERRRGLKERIKAAKRYKREVNNRIQSILRDYSDGNITHAEYFFKVNHVFRERRPHDLINYYDSYIAAREKDLKFCEREIRKLRRRKVASTVVSAFMVVAIVLSIVLVLIELKEKELLLAPEESYEQILNIVASENLDYEWVQETPGDLQSVSIGGTLKGEGEAKVYLITSVGEFLIYDSEADLLLSPGEGLGGFVERVAVSEIVKEEIDEESIREIMDECVETCDLSEYVLEEGVYDLRVEVENAEVTINLISYSVIAEEILEIPEEVPGIIKLEISTEKGRRVSVSIPAGEEGAQIFTEIAGWNLESADSIEVYWVEGEEFVEFQVEDLDNDGEIDRIEWLVPEIGDQTYDIIVITKAVHLDSNREYLSDIFDEVRLLDGIWSETIENQEYVRATFEIDLTNDNDISIFLRVVNGNPRIEVYEENGVELIAEFQDLQDGEFNTVFLDLLQGSQDTFDLRVMGGSIQIDYIVDPTQDLFENCVDLSDWILQAPWTEGTTGQDAGWCIARNTGGNEVNMTSSTIDLSVRSSANLTFTRSTRALDSGEYLRIYANSSVEDFVLIVEFTDSAESSHEFALEDFITLDGGVHLRAACVNNKNNERCRWDNINITSEQVANQAPTIPFVEDIGTVNPLEGGTRDVVFTFTAEDSINSDLKDSSARAKFERGGVVREGSGCVSIPLEETPTSRNYSCTVPMWYFDVPAIDWIINVTINDSADGVAVNSSVEFTYAALTAFKFAPEALSWGILNLGEENILALDLMLVNNTGNFDASINITGIDLYGDIGSDFIPAANFSVNDVNACEGTTLVNGTQVPVVGVTLSAGNNSLNTGDGLSGQEELYFCIEQVPNGILSQIYSSDGGIPWEINIFAVAFVVGGAGKKRKKKKVHKVNLLEALLEVLDEKLRERYDVDLGELISDERKESEEIEIPLEVFGQRPGPAESLSKFLKENIGLRIGEIARLLNRDRRTVGANYKNAQNKMKGKIRLKEKTRTLIPIEIFTDRDMSIMESLVYYLRKQGMRNSEIARIIDKDPRNIWTLYSRAVRKKEK